MNDTEIDVTPLFAAPGFDPWEWADYNERAERGFVSSTIYLHGGKLFWSCAQ